MERKLKFSEFAELIGTTPKTIYKMEERKEIVTVIEKVNNRPTRLVVTNEEQIAHFKNVYSKSPVNNGNCEEMLTDNNESMNNNNSSQSTNDNEIIQEMFDRIVSINEEYNNRIGKLNEELITAKSQLLFLEDKAGREGMYIAEINQLKTENERLKTNKVKVFNQLIAVIVTLLMVVVSLITFNVATSKTKQPLQPTVNQPTTTVNVKPMTSNKPVKPAKRK